MPLIMLIRLLGLHMPNFSLIWSINEVLVDIMMSYGSGNDQTTPIDTRLIMLIRLLVNLIPNFSLVGH